jgi:hypothetical protein
MVYLML